MKSLACLAAIVLAAAAHAVPAPKLLRPSSEWNLDFSNDSCVLLREFGQGPDRLTIGFKPSPMAESVRLIVVSEATTKRSTYGGASIGFGGTYKNVNAAFLAGYAGDKQVTSLFLQREMLAPLLAGSPLAISVRDRLNVAVTMDHFAEALKVLHNCELGLLKSWGMTEGDIKALVKHPKLINGTGFRPEDYPMDAAVTGQQGMVGVRLSLGADGLVRDCKVVESTGSRLLDGKSCNVFKKRARFEPARNGQGQAIPTFAYYVTIWAVSGHGLEYVQSSPPAVVPVAQ